MAYLLKFGFYQVDKSLLILAFLVFTDHLLHV